MRDESEGLNIPQALDQFWDLVQKKRGQMVSEGPSIEELAVLLSSMSNEALVGLWRARYPTGEHAAQGRERFDYALFNEVRLKRGLAEWGRNGLTLVLKEDL